jgi:hypothetical protein
MNHWMMAALEDNIVLISERIILMQLVSSSVGAISYGKSLLRSLSSAYKVSVIEDELSSMSGIAIVPDTQHGVFVNVVSSRIS